MTVPSAQEGARAVPEAGRAEGKRRRRQYTAENAADLSRKALGVPRFVPENKTKEVDDRGSEAGRGADREAVRSDTPGNFVADLIDLGLLTRIVAKGANDKKGRKFSFAREPTSIRSSGCERYGCVGPHSAVRGREMNPRHCRGEDFGQWRKGKKWPTIQGPNVLYPSSSGAVGIAEWERVQGETTHSARAISELTSPARGWLASRHGTCRMLKPAPGLYNL